MRIGHQRAQIIDGKKMCAKCDLELPVESFGSNPKLKSGLNSYCHKCEYTPTGKSRGRPKVGRSIRINKTSRKNGIVQTKEQRNAKRRARRKSDPKYRIEGNIRRAINGAMIYNKSKKSSKLSEYLGCTTIELKKHLESKFQSGMSWENYGYGSDKWNIDHIVPLASAKSIVELYKLNHYSNLQPLWQPDNFAKSDKIQFQSESILNIS